MTPFAALGLAETATRDEAAAAYRRLVKACHPDTHPDDPEAGHKVAALAEAYALVVKRIEAVQADALAKAEAGERRPPDTVTLHRNVFLTVHEAMAGCTKHVEGVAATCETCSGSGRIPTREACDCPACHGTGSAVPPAFSRLHLDCQECGGVGKVRWIRCFDCAGFGTVDSDATDVDIPPGSRSQDTLIVRHGANSRKENVVGDIHLTVVVSDPHFRMNGNDIETSVAVDTWDAVLGCSVHVAAPSGARFRLSLPAETAHGAKFRVRGQGLNYTEEKGDLVVSVRLRPMRLSDPGVAAAMHLLRTANHPV